MKSLLAIITLLSAFALADGNMFHCIAGEAPVSATDAASRDGRFTGTVEIYVTDWCGYCRQAQSYMKSKGIPFVAYDIEKDSAANLRHKELGGRGVPLIIIGSNRMSGFSARQLDYYLNNSK